MYLRFFSSGTDAFVMEEGFLVILSGGLVGERNFLGIDFIVSPDTRKSIITFNQFLDRVASLKIRIREANCVWYLVMHHMVGMIMVTLVFLRCVKHVLA